MRVFIAFTIIFSSIAIQAQDTNYVDPNYKPEKSRSEKKSKTPVSERMYYGGTFGLTIGSYTSVLLEPLVGFRMTEKLSTGIGIGVRYGSYNDPNFKFTFTNYLGRIFSRYMINQKIYGHIEYVGESYDKSWGDYVWSNNAEFKDGGRTYVPYLFVGGGLRQPTGNGSFILQVLFNVLDHQNSQALYPAGFPYLTIGYIGGF